MLGANTRPGSSSIGWPCPPTRITCSLCRPQISCDVPSSNVQRHLAHPRPRPLSPSQEHIWHTGRSPTTRLPLRGAVLLQVDSHAGTVELVGMHAIGRPELLDVPVDSPTRHPEFA